MPNGENLVTLATERRFSDLLSEQPSNGQATESINTEGIDLSKVLDTISPQVRALLNKHAALWSGKLGNIKESKHCIDLVPGVRSFRSQPYRASHKKHYLEAK